MRVQALNGSKPKTIVYKGEEVFTGIYKVPTAESRMVRILNIDALKKAASCDSLAKVWRNGFKNGINKLSAKGGQ